MTSDRGVARSVTPRLSYKPGWTLKIGGPLGQYFIAMAYTVDSQDHANHRYTQHMFRMPDGDFADEREFVQWVLDCLLLCEFHEATEFLEVDGFAPFFPNHQDEGSPYELVQRWEP